MIMQGAEPFFLPGGNKGVLLVHGFTGMPSEMLLLGRSLQEQGYTVLCPRLTGHGTSPQDLEHTTAVNWFDSVRDGYAVLAGCTDSISIAGLSMGALLALLLSAQAEVRCVVSMAAPIFIQAENRLKLLPPKRDCDGIFVPKHRRHLQDVPSFCNLSYSRMPLLAVHEFFDVMNSAKRRLMEVKRPLLILQGLKDRTVKPKSAEYIYAHVSSPLKKLCWLPDSGHLIPLESDREAAFMRIKNFFRENHF